LIVLSFRPVQSGPAVLVRGTHFRICSDGSLRGPDNTVAARYVDGLWNLGQRRHISFECTGPIHLRITNSRGRRDYIGPYALIRAADGAIYTQDSCLGSHAIRSQFGSEIVDVWQEVSFVMSG
jgi:hypothetical protein